MRLVHTKLSSLLTPVESLGVPKVTLGLIILQKDSQNSLKALTCMIMPYCRERIQIKIRQEKKHLGQNPGKSIKYRDSTVLSGVPQC